MAAYTATSWTVSRIVYDSVNIEGRHNRLRRGDFKITLPTGGEIPAAGVPIPKAMMGVGKSAQQYILHNDHDSNFTTAALNALKWEIVASAEKIKAYRYSRTSGVAAPSGGRMIRQLATTATLTSTHSLFVTAIGY